MDIILYLLQLIQYQHKQICWLLNFICRYLPLKQWAFDDSHSPKYQKFKVDELPLITDFKQEWTYKDLISYYEKRYHKKIKPIRRRSACSIPQDSVCPRCGAPHDYLYRNNGSKGQVMCKVCDAKFSPSESRFTKSTNLRCPHCGNSLVAKKNRRHFIVHKCVNPKCPYYLHNLGGRTHECAGCLPVRVVGPRGEPVADHDAGSGSDGIGRYFLGSDDWSGARSW